MFGEDTQIGRIARYVARSRLGAELAVRLKPIKQTVEPHYQRFSTFYREHCAATVLRTRNFIQKKAEEYKKYRANQQQVAKDQADRQAEAVRVLEAEMEAERAAAARAAYDPEGAIEDMRLANSYLEDWVAKNGNHVLGLAAQYIQLARTKDPNAKLTVQITKEEQRTVRHL